MSEMHPDDASYPTVTPELPLEVPEADAFDQTLVVADEDEDDYR